MSGSEQTEPIMRLNVPPTEYLQEFYNKCHDKDGHFCEDQPGGKAGTGLIGRIRRPDAGNSHAPTGDTSEGLAWSQAQPQNLAKKKPGAGPGDKVPRWTPENPRQAAALNRLKAVPTAGAKTIGEDFNGDWIPTKGEIDDSIKVRYSETKADELIAEHPNRYPPTKIKRTSIVGSEHYVRRNPVAETIHQIDQPHGPYGRPGYLPIVVPGDAGKYLLVNGNHRVQAASYLKEPYIEARVMNPDDIESGRS